jgi:exoribonuclease R
MVAFSAMSTIAPQPPQLHPAFDLAQSARAEMVHEGFHLFPHDSSEAPGAAEQLDQIRAGLLHPNTALNDLRGLLWSSIDNDTSRDLDQIEYAVQASDGIRVLVGIADVSAAVLKGTPLDLAAQAQAQTVYTAVHNLPMLPTVLSTDLTSLTEAQDRAAIVVEFTVDAQGSPIRQSIYPALVHNQAQLAYSTTGPWLEGKVRSDGRHETKLDADPALAANLRLQDQAAQRLHAQRIAMGALDFNRVEADPVVIDGKVQAIQAVIENRASTLIADFMIAANETMAMTLRKSGRSSIRRVVRSSPARARNCRHNRTLLPSTVSCRHKRRPIPSTIRTSRSPSSSSWDLESMCWPGAAKTISRDTSGLPRSTTRTPPHPTAALPTSSPSAC